MELGGPSAEGGAEVVGERGGDGVLGEVGFEIGGAREVFDDLDVGGGEVGVWLGGSEEEGLGGGEGVGNGGERGGEEGVFVELGLLVVLEV